MIQLIGRGELNTPYLLENLLHETNHSSGPGTIMEFGSKFSSGKLSISASAKALITGGRDLTVTIVGPSITAGYKLNLL